MLVKLPYGSKKIEFNIPDKNFCEILWANKVKLPKDIDLEIKQAIENPIGTGKLEEIMNPGKRVNIICDDITRPTPCDKILPILIKKLNRIGIRGEDIKIIMALGSHRYMTEDEMIKKVGKEIYKNYKVVNSEFKREEDLLDLGKAPDGVEIFASKVAMDCDIRIGIGNIVPHPAVGWSGGGKIIYPGITGEKTVVQFHIQQGLSDDNLYGMDECPVRLNMESWVNKVGLHFIINTILTPDFKIYRVLAGDYIKAHRKGVEYAKEIYSRSIKQKVDIVIVSSHPVDIDLWQSTKGYLCGEHGLKAEGGTIILVSPNFEGIGPHPEYIEHIGNDDADQLLIRFLKGEHIEGDIIALSVGACVSKLRQRRDLVIVSDGITKGEAEICKIKHYAKRDIQKAVDDSIARYNNPSVSVITHGGEMHIG